MRFVLRVTEYRPIGLIVAKVLVFRSTLVHNVSIKFNSCLRGGVQFPTGGVTLKSLAREHSVLC